MNSNDRKVFQEIVQSLKREIFAGRLKPGEKLLSERNLSEKFSAGRGAIREALKALEAIGFLSVVKGRNGGYFVKNEAPVLCKEALFSSLRLEQSYFLDSIVFRKIFEPKTCYYAAIMRTNKNLSNIERSILDMEEEGDIPERYAESNLSFHWEICKSCGNPFMQEIFPHLFEMLKDTAIMVHNLPTQRKATLFFHKEIFKAIKLREPDKSMTLMDAHLSYTENDMKEAKVLNL
jgi:GntR family transcriptional repressor for pyruvate dehydrogenase complex